LKSFWAFQFFPIIAVNLNSQNELLSKNCREQGDKSRFTPYFKGSNTQITKFSIASAHWQGPVGVGIRLAAPVPVAAEEIEAGGLRTMYLRSPWTTGSKLNQFSQMNII
jgi:hypothetical protein